MTSLLSSFALPATSLAARLPDDVPPEGILVGWSMEKTHIRQPMGFSFGNGGGRAASGYVDPILLENEGHLITIAPTGSGKGVGCIIPALLRHAGPAIVIDPKGENALVTARRRRELGQDVVVVDPMGITGLPSGSINPLDLIDPYSPSGVDEAVAVVSALLPAALGEARNSYWINRARQLLLSTILHVVTDLPPQERTIFTLRNLIGALTSDRTELIERFQASRHPEVRLGANDLGLQAQETFGGIVSFAQEGVDFIRGPQIHEATRTTSFPLDSVTRGDPLTIYIVLPPHMMESHARLLRLWVSTLLKLITRRRARPPRSTLFLLDEAAQLGPLDELRTAVTLLRGYGLQTWSFWQDTSQLKALYPIDWATMVNNCKVFQAFGANNLAAAQEVSRLVGFVSAETFLDLESNEMLLQIAGDEAVVAQVPNYRTNPVFAGQFDENPLFEPGADPVPEPVTLREYIRPKRRVVAPVQEIPSSAAARGPGPRNAIDAMIADALLDHLAQQATDPP